MDKNVLILLANTNKFQLTEEYFRYVNYSKNNRKCYFSKLLWRK